MKKCRDCHKEKSLDEFRVRSRYKDKQYLSAECRRCEAKRAAARFHRLKGEPWFQERKATISREWIRKERAERPEHYRLLSRVKESRRRARKASNGGSHTWEEWVSLVQEFPICFCCGEPGDEHTLHQDHIVPISKGGTDDIWNIQPLCRRCNCKKNVKPLNYSIPGIPFPVLGAVNG